MEAPREIVGQIREEIQRRAISGEVKEQYIKACVGRLAIQRIDPFTGREETVILKGDITDPKVDKDEITVLLYTDLDAQWFKRANKKLIERGLLVPDTTKIRESLIINSISDNEIEKVLSEPFFSLKAKLDKFTTPTPVDRILRKAKLMNKTVGTINAIEKRLAELQEAEVTVSDLETTYEL